MFYSINDARKNLLDIQHRLDQLNLTNKSDLDSFITTLLSICDIAVVSEDKTDVLTQDEITDIGEQAFSLIDNLVYSVGNQHPDIQQQVTQLSLAITQWVIDHNGVLGNIQSVVDALANLANTIQDKPILAKLAFFMSNIAHACNADIIHDLDNANPSRPWRVLNLNRGIVATRCLDLNVMKTVFPELIEAIPMDAPSFFEEGMSEMLRLNYPNDVTAVMQDFFDRTKLPAVH